MTEMIWVITLLGILATLAIGQFNGISEASRLTIAQEKVEVLNRGLTGYNSIVRDNYKIESFSSRSDSSDENTILLALQFRHSTNPTMGAPYVDPRYRPATSSSTDEYRIEWSGSMFRLLKPGSPGTGLLVAFDGSDYGTPFPFTDSFRPLGR